MTDLPIPSHARRAPPGTLLELATFEELCAEIRARKPIGAIVGIVTPTQLTGLEHTPNRIDLDTCVGGSVPALRYLCSRLAALASNHIGKDLGWADG